MITSGKTIEEACVEYVFEHAIAGNAESVMNTIDEFCHKRGFMMNVGDEKGLIVDAEVRKKQPKFAIELGGYCGYSAIRIARLLPEGAQFVSLEINPVFAAFATKLIELAGLAHVITVKVGVASDSIREMAATRKRFIDFVLLDHWKDMYVPDIKTIIESEVLAPGAVVVADNTIFPGAPEYLEFIRASPLFTSVQHMSHLEYSTKVDAIEVSTLKP